LVCVHDIETVEQPPIEVTGAILGVSEQEACERAFGARRVALHFRPELLKDSELAFSATLSMF
jgi:hypothetical protein